MSNQSLVATRHAPPLLTPPPPSGFPLEAFAALDPANWGLADFDLPHRMVGPLLRAFRHVNTLADTMFYDVGMLWLRLYTHGITLTTASRGPAAAQDRLAALETAARIVNLSALANPEGAILLIDAHH